MAIKQTGTLSIIDIANEFGGNASDLSLSDFYAAAAGIPTAGNTIEFSDFYGASSVISPSESTMTARPLNQEYVNISTDIAGFNQKTQLGVYNLNPGDYMEVSSDPIYNSSTPDYEVPGVHSVEVLGDLTQYNVTVPSGTPVRGSVSENRFEFAISTIRPIYQPPGGNSLDTNSLYQFDSISISGVFDGSSSNQTKIIYMSELTDRTLNESFASRYLHTYRTAAGTYKKLGFVAGNTYSILIKGRNASQEPVLTTLFRPARIGSTAKFSSPTGGGLFSIPNFYRHERYTVGVGPSIRPGTAFSTISIPLNWYSTPEEIPNQTFGGEIGGIVRSSVQGQAFVLRSLFTTDIPVPDSVSTGDHDGSEIIQKLTMVIGVPVIDKTYITETNPFDPSITVQVPNTAPLDAITNSGWSTLEIFDINDSLKLSVNISDAFFSKDLKAYDVSIGNITNSDGSTSLATLTYATDIAWAERFASNEDYNLYPNLLPEWEYELAWTFDISNLNISTSSFWGASNIDEAYSDTLNPVWETGETGYLNNDQFKIVLK